MVKRGEKEELRKIKVKKLESDLGNENSTKINVEK